jgi:hypothetical protein
VSTVLALVVAGWVGGASARELEGCVGTGLWVSHHVWAKRCCSSVPRHSFADRCGKRGAFRPRLGGFKQLVDLATSGGHAVRRTRVESCPSGSRGLGQAADVAVA